MDFVRDYEKNHIHFYNYTFQNRAVALIDKKLMSAWKKNISWNALWQINRNSNIFFFLQYQHFLKRIFFPEWQRQCLRHPCHCQRFQPQQSLDGTDQGKWLGDFGKHLLENDWEILENVHYKMIERFWQIFIG